MAKCATCGGPIRAPDPWKVRTRDIKGIDDEGHLILGEPRIYRVCGEACGRNLHDTLLAQTLLAQTLRAQARKAAHNG